MCAERITQGFLYGDCSCNFLPKVGYTPVNHQQESLMEIRKFRDSDVEGDI